MALVTETRRRRMRWAGIAAAGFLLISQAQGCSKPAARPTVPPQQAASAAVPAPPPGAEISLDRNYYIIVDGSGSMTDTSCAGKFGNRIEGAKWAVKEFVGKGVQPNVALGLYVFDNTGASERVPLGKENRQAIAAAVEKISGGGNTPLNGSIKRGAGVLAQQREKQLGYGEFYLIVATDGQASDGPGNASDGVRSAVELGVPIITIGYCLPDTHPLARDSVSYRNANDPEQLLSALRESQAESPYFDTQRFGR